MKRNIAIIAAILAVILGVVIGLTQAEDKKYSY